MEAIGYLILVMFIFGMGVFIGATRQSQQDAKENTPSASHNTSSPKLPNLEECNQFVKVNITDGILTDRESTIVTEMYFFIMSRQLSGD